MNKSSSESSSQKLGSMPKASIQDLQRPSSTDIIKQHAPALAHRSGIQG